MRQSTFQSTAKIKYEQDQCVALVDQEIVEFYRNLIPDYYNVKPQKAPAHITVVRKGKETPTNMEFWGKHEGKIITFKYKTEIKSDNTYYWLDAYSDDIGSIREELGLTFYRDDTLFGGSKHNEYHITLGNIKC